MSGALGAWLLDEARAVGFDDAALVRADLGTPGAARVRAAAEGGALAALPWLQESVPVRADVTQLCPDAKTVLVVAVGYYAGDHDEHDDGEGARVSRYAWGGDYHMWVRKRLRKLRKRLLQRAPEGARVDVFCDVDAVLERSWAAAAGLGFVGKSALFIHRELGTWTFLGGLVTDVDLDAAAPAPLTDLCADCTLCLDACPTEAFRAPGVVDVARCLTTWTVERPHDDDGGLLAGEGWAFGCDVCQEVCPWNHTAPRTTRERFQPRAGHVRLEPTAGAPADLDGTPLARAGADGLERSARRALASAGAAAGEPDVAGER